MLRVGRVDGGRASLLNLYEEEGGDADVQQEEEQRLILQILQYAGFT